MFSFITPVPGNSKMPVRMCSLSNAKDLSYKSITNHDNLNNFMSKFQNGLHRYRNINLGKYVQQICTFLSYMRLTVSIGR
jgi:hypothetical protein